MLAPSLSTELLLPGWSSQGQPGPARGRAVGAKLLSWQLVGDTFSRVSSSSCAFTRPQGRAQGLALARAAHERVFDGGGSPAGSGLPLGLDVSYTPKPAPSLGNVRIQFQNAHGTSETSFSVNKCIHTSSVPFTQKSHPLLPGACVFPEPRGHCHGLRGGPPFGLPLHLLLSEAKGTSLCPSGPQPPCFLLPPTPSADGCTPSPTRLPTKDIICSGQGNVPHPFLRYSAFGGQMFGAGVDVPLGTPASHTCVQVLALLCVPAPANVHPGR